MNKVLSINLNIPNFSPVGVTSGDISLQGHSHCGQQRPVLHNKRDRVQVGQKVGEESYEVRLID